MTALSTSARSGAMTSSLSVSVFDGAICSSGISSPVAGSRYWTKLWCDNSASSSIRMPVRRRTSTAAQAQNARCSSKVRSRRLPPAGSPAHILALVPVLVITARRSVCPAAVNTPPGAVPCAATRIPAAVLRAALTAATRTGKTGSRSLVRWSIRDLRCERSFLRDISSSRIGQGTAHGPQRAGSPAAHWAMSR
ncbi:MAG: hypothetical protein ACRD0H_21990 [Actinomycetes bacterium]